MVMSLEQAATVETKPSLVVVMEFADAQRYLQDVASQNGLDTDPQYIQAILQLVVGEVLDYANSWSDSDKLGDAINAMLDADSSADFAYAVARQLHDMISVQVCLHIPQFGAERYSGKYTYNYIGGLNGKVKISYWANGVA